MENMAYTKPFPAATAKRGALVLLVVCMLALSAFANGPVGAAAAPVATSLRTVILGEATLITISGTAPMPYTVRRPDGRSVVVELPGVDGSQLSPTYEISSPLVESLTVKRGLREGAPLSTLQVTLRAPARERSRLEGSQLVLELVPEKSDADGSAAQSRPTPAPANQSQASQGAQYGQPGFVGEPISVNVVNSDIRDILNYITEQYGVNFVVDSSVERVPVTINVTDVPWNFALDSILKANRLGIEVNGNILRVATLNVLKDESKIRAEEEMARGALKEAQLSNSPLVTEFIRLNYARAAGTLDSTAGAAGNFSGGVASGSSQGGTTTTYLPDGTIAQTQRIASSDDQGILPIVQRRLSRRGGVEVDGRSNTLIITDVKENIEAIRRLVQLLDQPEPQVEIETRIVLANRTFSRDLGVQSERARPFESRRLNRHTAELPGTPGVGTNANTIGLRPPASRRALQPGRGPRR
jgi:type II secretory pathway component HofQ